MAGAVVGSPTASRGGDGHHEWLAMRHRSLTPHPSTASQPNSIGEAGDARASNS